LRHSFLNSRQRPGARERGLPEFQKGLSLEPRLAVD
jgi:hypothetical protein